MDLFKYIINIYHLLQLESPATDGGARPQNLLLPILLDIANIIRSATDARTARAIEDTVGSKRAFAFLMRASDILMGTDQPSSTSATATAAASQEPEPVAALLRDDRMQLDVDADDVLTTHNLVADQQQTAASTAATTTTSAESLPTPAAQHQAKRSRALFSAPPPPHDRRLAGDQRSYHERKLNMTAFNGTRTGNADQFAMESEGVPIQITLPRATANAATPRMPDATQQQQQLTLEQYEERALRDLNATITDAAGADGQNSNDNGDDEDRSDSTMAVEHLRNATTGELLPLPEMLISRHRNKNNPFRKQLAAGGNDLGAAASAVPSSRACERFGSSLCLHVEDYPT